jgi:hypothetical protein
VYICVCVMSVFCLYEYMMYVRMYLCVCMYVCMYVYVSPAS